MLGICVTMLVNQHSVKLIYISTCTYVVKCCGEDKLVVMCQMGGTNYWQFKWFYDVF